MGHTPAAPGDVAFINPAADCPTRLCMVTPDQTVTKGHTGPLAICTGTFDTDSDCAAPSDYTTPDRCMSQKFVCAVPSVVPGPENFCCQKLCVCKDDLIAGFNVETSAGAKLPTDTSGVTIPSACDPNVMVKGANGQLVTRRDKTCNL